MKSAFPKWKFLCRLIRMFEVEHVTIIPQNHLLQKVEKRMLLYSSLLARVSYNTRSETGFLFF